MQHMADIYNGYVAEYYKYLCDVFLMLKSNSAIDTFWQQSITGHVLWDDALDTFSSRQTFKEFCQRNKGV